MRLFPVIFLATAALACAVGCTDRGATLIVQTRPIYNAKTGVLEELTQDRNRDGKVDLRGFMEGAHIIRVEIDRNYDGKPDRWEYYGPPDPSKRRSAGAAVGFGYAFGDLVRADESNGRDGAVTRRETYEDGFIHRVIEDANNDGRDDKWEFFEQGGLVRVDLDMQGWGVPDRRLIYGKNGTLDHVEMLPRPKSGE